MGKIQKSSPIIDVANLQSKIGDTYFNKGDYK